VVLEDPKAKGRKQKAKGIRLKESNKSYSSGIMKNILKILLFLFIVELFSCEKQGLIVKCPDCVSDEPVKTSLNVKLDEESNSSPTVINVFEGNFEDSVLYGSYESAVNYYSTIQVSLNKKYTVTATYHIGDNYYVAIDSATPRVRYDKTQCDNPCYFVYDKDIDLRLKYTK
jgi:hypothetical protein